MDEHSRGSEAPGIDGTIVYQREAHDAEDKRERQPSRDRGKGGDGAQVAASPMTLQRHQIWVVVHNDTSQSLNNVVFKWFTELKKYGISMMEGVTKDKSSLISNASPTDIYTLNLDEAFDQGSQKSTILENLEQSWCEFVFSISCRHLWLEVKHLTTTERALSSAKHTVEVASMSLGSFPSTGRYCLHWSSGVPCAELKIVICFEYDLKIGTITYEDHRRGQWKLETALDHLDKFLLVTPMQTEFHVYLFQKNSFKILQSTIQLPYRGPPTNDVIDKEEDADPEFLWQRKVSFGDCPTDVIGSSNVVCLKLGKNDLELNDVLSRLTKLGFSIITGNPSVETVSPHVRIFWPKFESFRLTYAWYCLISRGFRVTDQLTKAFIDLINKNHRESWLEETIKAITAAFDNNSICNMENQFKEESEKIKRHILAWDLEDDEDGFLVPHVVAIRRLILTPTTVKGLGEEWTVENRVLREFGADRFVRISFRDEDFTRLTGYIPICEITNRVINFLKNGFDIGSQHYGFLGCSNSQMRSHSVWMYASDGVHTVDSIRKWMGDVSHERCVATYVSRLGQCFTSTRNTVEVKNVELIDDIQRDTNYCFTDGIGRISTTLANRVKATLRLDYTPSAFQIRFGGCKGVVALAPDIGEEEKLQIRKSMEKFPSRHNHIEVVETTRPVRLCLNRQAMLLLSGLGVPDDSFFKLQDRMLENMAQILIDEGSATKVIAKAHLGIELKELEDSGIAVTLEPFLREVLATIYRQQFNDLLKRTHIEIPEDKGRMMMGTVDEFDCMEYGEVFVQFSKNIDKPMQQKVVLDGSVVVTKSPCFHPGDMRKFTAVDRVQLHHMVDCIVFPAKGQRPHPNEMSGSDLDGDLYFVCWEESLIPPGKNEQPMDFTPKEKETLSEPVTESDMIRFIGNYIRSDQLGVIANAHLVRADSNDIYCDECIQIAQQHSYAVDFPKTGQRQSFPKELRPASYPDYMMKTDKPSYISDTVIGKLFHQCRAIGLSNEFRKLEPILPDPDLILPGHETHLNAAKQMKAIYDTKIDELKAMYGIETEVELLSVGTLGMKERLGHLKGDHYAATELIRLRIQTIKKKMKNMFYQAFGEPSGKYNNAQLRRKASALYRVSYSCPEHDLDKCSQNPSIQKANVAKENVEKAKNTEGAVEIDEPYRKSLGLPWIFSHLLCMIKKENATASRFALQDLRETEVKPTSFLHKISLDMDEVAITADRYWKKKDLSGQEPLLIERLNLWNSRISSDSEYVVQLICFGSAITSCVAAPTSLDIFIRNDSSDHSDVSFEQLTKIAKDLAQFVEGKLPNFRKSKARNRSRVRVVNIPGVFTEINLYSDERYLRRTEYIVAAVMLNKWTVPVLRVVLHWGRNCGIADSSSNSLLTEEELTIMFYHAVINGIEYGNPVRDKDLRRSNLLIVKNHFQTCNLFTCTHLQTDLLAADGSSSTDGFHDLGEGADASGRVCSRPTENVTTRCGRAILGFFLFYGASRGSNLKAIPDPRLKPNDEQCLLNLKDEQYIQVGEQMLEAYHSLANCAGIDDFISPKCLEDRRFTMVLPNEVTSLYRYMEAGLERNLKRETGASVVNVRRKKFRGFPSGHVIEAWGNAIAIKSLSARIQGIISSAACFTVGKIARDRWLISGAYRTTFEGILGPSDTLQMVEYVGRCQDWHEPRLRQIPLVNSYRFDSMDAYNMKKVSDYFEEQRDFIRKNHKSEIHGRIRVTISFGNFYTVGYRTGYITAGELGKNLSKKPNCKKAAHVKGEIRTPYDYRRQDPRNIVRPTQTSENCTMERSSTPSPQPFSRGYSSVLFDSVSACGDAVLSRTSAYRPSCENSTRQIPPNANDSRDDMAENTRSHNSYLRHSGATGHSFNYQNPTSHDSSVGLVNRQLPQQQLYGVPEVGCGAVSDHGRRLTSTPESASKFPRGYTRNKYSAFLPISGLDVDRLHDFLKQNNFVETEHQREHRATVNDVADITLDENFKLTMYRLQDIKWYVFNVVRGRIGERFRDKQLKDIRIQMRSRPLITAEELEERPGCKDLLKNADQILRRNSDGVVDGVALRNYEKMIKYIRYKDRTTYQFRGRGPTKTRKRDDWDDVFLNRFTLKFNRGTEHRLQLDGCFKKTEHTEVLLETDMPNLEDKEECEEFMREIYELSKYFAKCVIE